MINREDVPLRSNHNDILLAKIYHYEEPISPINQYKARAIRVRGRWLGTIFMPSKFTKYQERFKKNAKTQLPPKLIPYDGDIRAEADFFFGTRRKKDLPNGGKLELDALNKLVYIDDSQIKEFYTRSFYDKASPGIVIRIYKII